jgi:hypothetical protein
MPETELDIGYRFAGRGFKVTVQYYRDSTWCKSLNLLGPLLTIILPWYK